MKILNTLLLSSLFVVAAPLFAEESVTEKAAATTNNAGRSMKKGAHKVAEAVCMEGDAKCAAKKLKHRATEGKDYVNDKAKEIDNKVDSNSSPSH